MGGGESEVCEVQVEGTKEYNKFRVCDMNLSFAFDFCKLHSEIKGNFSIDS